MFEYSSDQEWNQKLNDAYSVYRELKDIYLNRGKQETIIVFIRYITYYSLIFLVLKQVKEHNNNEWKMEVYPSWVLLCVWGPLL